MILDYERYQFKTAKKSKKLLSILLLLIIIASLITLFFIFNIPEHINLNFLGIQNDQEDISSLWNNRLYDEIIIVCDKNLKNNPLDPNYNVFRAFSFFYKAYAKGSFEEKVILLNESIISLRRALLTDNIKNKSQVYYMLGKVYFHKDKYYFDLCIKYLNKSLELGYDGQDTYEYLAVAYDEMGKPQKAIEYFLLAYEQRPLDIYLWYVAKKYADLKSYENAEEYLIRTLNKTKDKELIKECLFLLGNIYFEIEEYMKAEQFYNRVFEYDNNSAEAYYHIALIYKKYWELYRKSDDYAKCRAYLREALDINPKHKGAQHLMDKLNGGI